MMFGALTAGLGLASSLFGGGGKGGKPQQSTQLSGWQALPKEAQNAYLKNYLPKVLEYGNSPSNQYTQQAMQGYGGGLAGLLQQLPEYRKVFDQNTVQPTLDGIQRQTDIQKNMLQAQAARSGLGGLLNSNTAIQLSEMQNGADRIKAEQLANFNRENTTNALNLRGQTLSDLMFAGDQNYNNLSRFASLLGAFPGGNTSSSIGPTGPKPNFWDKAAGAATSLPSIFNSFGGGGQAPWQQQQSLGNQMPWLYK
jgi:hypothetical protein